MKNSSGEELIFKTSDKRPALIITKYVALQGTSLIAHMKEKELVQRFHPDIVKNAKSFIKECDVSSEKKVIENTAPAFVIEIKEGGFLRALWEAAERTEMGIDADLNRVPIKQETVEICELYSLNPYEINSTGSLLIATTHEMEICEALEKIGVNAVVVGSLNRSKDKILRHNGIKSCLNRPTGKEISEILDEL